MARNQSALTFCKPLSLPTNELTDRKEVCPIRGELSFSAEGGGLGGEGSAAWCLRVLVLIVFSSKSSSKPAAFSPKTGVHPKRKRGSKRPEEGPKNPPPWGEKGLV